MDIFIYLLGLVLLDPWRANELVARGDQVLELHLDRTCWRESKCQRLGVHEIDAWAGRQVYRNAVKRKWLDPERCPFHRDRNAGWSTRGPHGLMAGYNLRFVPIPCLPAAAMDVPFVSAWAAANKVHYLCAEKGACTFPKLRSWWARGRPPRSRQTVVSNDPQRFADHVAEMSDEGWAIESFEKEGSAFRIDWRPL